MTTPAKESPVGFIGMGTIGLPAAINLIKAGYSVVGFSLDNMDKFQAEGGLAAQSAADVAARCDVIVHCLPIAKSLDAAVYGETGILKTLRPGTVVIELSTYALEDKQRLRDALVAAKGHLLDCELTARAAGKSVAERECIIFAGGDKQLVDRFQPLFDAVTRHVVYVGEFGATLRLKTVNNLLVGVHFMAAAEAISLARKAGIDPRIVSDLLSGGAGGSASLALYGRSMAEENFDRGSGGPMSIFDKYFDLVEELAGECGAKTPLLDVTRALYRQTIAMGYGDRGIASIVRAFD